MRSKALMAAFAAVLFLAAVFVAWYVPAASRLHFQIEETEKSLETNRGRERKQLYELGQTVAGIPAVRTEMVFSVPFTEEAHHAADSLKKERNALRSLKKELEKKTADQPAVQEDAGHE